MSSEIRQLRNPFAPFAWKTFKVLLSNCFLISGLMPALTRHAVLARCPAALGRSSARASGVKRSGVKRARRRAGEVYHRPKAERKQFKRHQSRPPRVENPPKSGGKEMVPFHHILNGHGTVDPIRSKQVLRFSFVRAKERIVFHFIRGLQSPWHVHDGDSAFEANQSGVASRNIGRKTVSK